ncbi:EAL domain-containing protein [Shewanella sp. TC10]|uniref:bifunctional diguanylate cyclase/phosphodiesterase n=1 Tax=Shewanella sp. TC10 TaxID=1419739 RepID=UPI001892BF77|nr:EAL domain-containing protein [Shewanella sp. TC10]
MRKSDESMKFKGKLKPLSTSTSSEFSSSDLTTSYSGFNSNYIVLFLLYIASAYTFFLLSPSNQVSSLWPAAGIALASCIKYRAYFLPAIFFGSVIFQIGSQLLNSNPIEISLILISLGIGIISAIQAWVNYRLLAHFSVNIIEAPTLRIVTIFIFFALLSSFIGSFSSCLLVDMALITSQPQLFWTNLAIWWQGNFLGIIIVTPIFLALLQFNKPTFLVFGHYRGLVYPLIFLLVTFVAIQKYTGVSIRKSSIEEIKLNTELIEKQLNHQVETYLYTLSKLADKLSGKETITQEEFKNLALPLIQKNKGIQAFSWNPIIEQNEKLEFERSVKNQISSEFTVRGTPIQKEDPLVVVKWIEPFGFNEKAFGFNVFSNEARREAMIKAQNLNTPVATEIINLVQLKTQEPGFLIFYPINKGPSLSNDYLTQSLSLSGYAVGVFVVSDIVLGSINKYSDYINIRIKDLDANGDEIFNNHPSEDDSTHNAIEVSFPLHVATRNWEVILCVSHQTVSLIQANNSVNALFYESVFGTLCVLLILTLFGTHKILINQVKARTNELVKSRDELKKYAFNDPLTNLANRRKFIKETTKILNIAKAENKIVAILFLDLNRFKYVNDSLGHEFGDRLLIEVAKNFRSNLRKDDMLARFGGDEFTIMLDNILNVNEAILVSKKLINGLHTAIQIDDNSLFISTSIGIAIYPKDGSNVYDLIRAADTAMYKAKESSAGYFCYSSILRKQATAKLFIESELPQALDNNQLELYFQPIVEIVSGNQIGCECLLRWNHPLHGLISPDRFIPTAELSGEIIPIGAWVIDQACKNIQQWERQGFYHQKVSVNVSVVQLMTGKLIENIVTSLKRYEITANKLELEITESVLMQNIEIVTNLLKKLRKIGVRIAIDDYGTGYSSLSYLDKLPIDTLKIDRIFIEQINEGNLAIVCSTLQLANELGIDVVAEGIQTTKQIRVLNEYSCRWGQGYLFSQPLPITEYENFYKSSQDNKVLNRSF